MGLPLTVLTPTGARPEAFAACVRQMRAQDYTGPVRWVIVDDGPDPMPTPEVDGWEIVHIRPEPVWQPGQNTLARNLMAGLGQSTGRVVVVEDDDEYADWWLARCAERLDEADLIGESHSVYRNIRTGGRLDCGNAAHASLCSTALKGAALDCLRRVCMAGAKGIDLRLWRQFDGSKKLYRPDPRGVTGIKGYPGRPGIGVGHRI